MKKTTVSPLPEVCQTISLYYKDGRSDKLYAVEMKPDVKPGTATVWATWGRRGGSLRTEKKTPAPLPLEEAKKLFQSLVREKTAKGYRSSDEEAPAMVPAVGSAAPEPFDLPSHMLLNAITRDEADWLLKDDKWMLQPKFDGQRVRIVADVDGGRPSVYGLSRTNNMMSLPAPLVYYLTEQPRTLILDGELVGTTLVVFDALLIGSFPLWKESAAARVRELDGLFQDAPGIVTAVTAQTNAEKTKLFAAIHNEGMEGAVFKLKSAPYEAGRPNTGGVARKLKFVNTCTVIAGARRGSKRSVDMLLDDGQRIGSVTIPPNKEIPPIGALCEIRYLYRHDVGGDLVQAVYLGVRDDATRADCTVEQLVVKGEARA